LIEEQIQKLTTNSEALANRVSLLENENADLKAKLASTQNKLDDVIAAAVTPAPTTTMPFDAPAFSYSCSDDGNAEADCPPTVNAVGSDVHISACCGSVAIHSADCSLNPCRLLAEVEDLKRRMP